MNKILIPLIVILGILCAYLYVQGASVKGGAIKTSAEVEYNPCNRCLEICENYKLNR